MANMKDVAAAAGVSKSTVSQYLNHNYEFMSTKTRAKIQQAIAELGYVPNQLARGLRKKKTNLVGVIVSTIRSGFPTEIIEAVEADLAEQHMQILVCNSHDDPQKERDYIENLVARQVDAIITFPYQENLSVYQELLNQNCRLFFIDRMVLGLTTPVTTVLLDNRLAIRLLMDELTGHGHTRIGMIAFPFTHSSITPRVERTNAYLQYVADHARLIQNAHYLASGEISEIATGFDQMMDMEIPPTGIIATNDMILETILKRANQRQIRVPNDLSIVGVDEIPAAEIFVPGITTIAQSPELMAQTVVQELLHPGRQAGGPIYRIKPQLIRRNSVKDMIIKSQTTIDN